MTIDPDVFVARGAVVLGDVEIGPGSSVWYQTVIRGDAERIRIGSSTNVQDLCLLHADPGLPCLVGDRVTVGHRVILHGCVIEDDCLIGMGAIILNGAVVGAGSVVSAGALVREGQIIPPGSLAVGMPARVLRAVDDKLAERVDLSWRHYVAMARRHRDGEFPPVAP
jgi:carbonic anhydrase/acetyltransferase-like protein (isoleucine patch superfamily)